MKIILIIIIFLVPFISYAEKNDDFCKNSNSHIDNLTNSNNYDNIYNYLTNNYTHYYNTCGDTEHIKSLINKYISLVEKNNFNNVSDSDYISLLKSLRLSISDDKFQNALKKYYLYMTNYIRNDNIITDSKYVDEDEDYIAYGNQLLKDEIDANLANYYKVDTNDMCRSDGDFTYQCTFIYSHNKPIKVSGTLTVSNLYNTENTKYPNYFKASFKADNMDIDFSKLFVVPINYKLNTKIPKNYLQTGAAGEITFNVDFILDRDSVIIKGESTVGDITSIYVKDLNINSVKNIKYYDKSYLESYPFPDIIKKYELWNEDSYINLRDKPNGKIVYQIKINHNDSSDESVYFYEGYKEPGIRGYLFGYGNPSINYVYNYYKILRFSKSISNNWLFVTYFPKNSTKPVFGYIHSSQIIHDLYYVDTFDIDNEIGNIDTLSYKETFDILHNFIGEDVYIKRLNYEKNQKLQTLIDRYVSILLSDNFIFDTWFSYDMIFINSLYYYLSDNTYYKIIDKFINDSAKYNKLQDNKTKIVVDKYIYKIISPKYAPYFKQIESQSELKFDSDFEDYGIYDVKKYIDSLEIERAVYTFNSPKPVKITGKVIVKPSSMSFNFIPDDFLVKADKLYIYPLDYTINKAAYSNLFTAGYHGIVSFDVELTLSKNSLLQFYGNELDLYVDNMYIKSANNISYFDFPFYSEEKWSGYAEISTYTVSSKNGSAQLLDSPNGKVLANVKNRDKVYLTSFTLPYDYFSGRHLWLYILNYKHSISGKYYRVIYFPEGVIDGSKAISGYIDSSLLKKVEK